jgi:phenylalanyl-tRNA synthetase beta chain
MIVSLKWLRNYVDVTLTVDELVHRLTMVGLEVEGVSALNPHLQGVIPVRVQSVDPHPRADRLHLCRVSDGEKEYQVVCGAPNVRAGVVAPLALPGTEMPNGMVLREARLRGEVSQGMLCSQKELGLGEDASGIWLLPETITLGIPLSRALDIEDTIIEVSITPNRGDCLSILGIAREVAAICGAPLRYPSVVLEEKGPAIDGRASVVIEDPVGCPRYAARLVEGITIGPSPRWLRESLEAVGLRSINNIVDVTNFILMEMGQPLHAFDFDSLREHRIVVRRARGGERFTTLDGVERTLFDDTLLICDGAGPVAIAGIMGGLDSEITSGTSRVLIESAYFQPVCIRRTGKKIGLRSESSYRFERGVDPEGVLRAVDRAAALMAEVGGGVIAAGRIDVYPQPIERPVLSLRVDRTNRFLGTRLEASRMAEVLKSIEMDVRELDADRLEVIPPAFRPDISREVDLTEEVARLVGYDQIPVTHPHVELRAEPLDPHFRMRQEAKSFLAGAGFFEVINYSFIGQESLRRLMLASDDPRLHPVVVKNPLSEDQGVMRTSLLPGLLQTVRHNFGHRNDDLRIFELSKVFLPRAGEALPAEPHHLAGILTGKRDPHLLYGGEEEVDFADARGIVESVLDLFYLEGVRFADEALPSYLDAAQAASIFCGEEWVGALGKFRAEVQEAFDLKKNIMVFEVDFDKVFNLKQSHPMFRSLPKYPPVARDMALIVDENLSVQEPLDYIWGQKEALLEQVEVFDIYRNPQWGKGKKSVGYRLVYRSPERSLTDEEINDIHSGLVRKVLDAFHATLR